VDADARTLLLFGTVSRVTDGQGSVDLRVLKERRGHGKKRVEERKVFQRASHLPPARNATSVPF